jgi:hypothetical protein
LNKNLNNGVATIKQGDGQVNSFLKYTTRMIADNEIHNQVGGSMLV